MRSFWLLFVFLYNGEAEFQHNRMIFFETDFIIEFRRYTCVIRNEKEPSDCTLMFKDDIERTTTNHNGCFTEKDATRNQILTYCPLQCAEAESAYVMLKRPSNNNKCLAFFTYNVAQRKNDWFLWRSGKCLFEEIQFDIGCTFPFKKNINFNTIKQNVEVVE
ncbi:unnamed protein product [Brugia pahangi]|uniref:DUF3707 domain-containing protein n=1 Tax=Brugia pahangi TaxID=6280 RepID=A0A0N4TK62_BRUPA|nr:unnamed protein product [Brugia pahangi]